MSSTHTANSGSQASSSSWVPRRDSVCSRKKTSWSGVFLLPVSKNTPTFMLCNDSLGVLQTDVIGLDGMDLP